MNGLRQNHVSPDDAAIRLGVTPAVIRDAIFHGRVRYTCRDHETYLTEEVTADLETRFWKINPATFAWLHTSLGAHDSIERLDRQAAAAKLMVSTQSLDLWGDNGWLSFYYPTFYTETKTRRVYPKVHIEAVRSYLQLRYRASVPRRKHYSAWVAEYACLCISKEAIIDPKSLVPAEAVV